MERLVNKRHREIASSILIDTRGRFLLQQRDDVPGIVQPGKIGLFGGHREEGETFLQCVVREIHEETSFFIPPERFEHLVSYTGPEFEAEGDTVRGEFFVARDVPADEVIVTEGALLMVEPDNLALIEHKFAPSVQFAMKAFSDSRRGLSNLRD